MRVITGTAKGRKLKAPKGKETRPTSDRTKESLFNIIGPRVINAKFLDLYAGTGAIGIEALSRGADLSVFVEKNPQAVKNIKSNLELTGLADRAEVISQEAEKAVDMLAAWERTFDIIFVDPPYLKGLVNESLLKINKSRLLASGGVVITESSKLDVLPVQAGLLKMVRHEKYGDTILSFYQEM